MSSANCCICQKVAATLKETAPLLRTIVGTPPIMLEDLLEQCIGKHKAQKLCKDAAAVCICKCCQSKLLEYYEATLYVQKKRKEFKRRIKQPSRQSATTPNPLASVIVQQTSSSSPTFLDIKPKVEQSSYEGTMPEDPLIKKQQDEDALDDMDWCNDNKWHEQEENDFQIEISQTSAPAVTDAILQPPLSLPPTADVVGKSPLYLEDNEPLAAIKIKMQEERANRYCRECEVECPSEEVYHLHVKKFHPTEFSTKANFVCAQCRLQLASDDAYRQHMVEVHQRNGAEFQCNTCGGIFNTHSQLITHAASHTAHTCTICGKTLSHRRGLLRHMETHSTEKKHQCAECGNKYPTTSSLKKHMMIHSDTRNHQCPTCGNRFRSASHLKRHQNTHTSTSSGAKKS